MPQRGNVSQRNVRSGTHSRATGWNILNGFMGKASPMLDYLSAQRFRLFSVFVENIDMKVSEGAFRALFDITGGGLLHSRANRQGCTFAFIRYGENRKCQKHCFQRWDISERWKVISSESQLWMDGEEL